jgi:hypothetical protein
MKRGIIMWAVLLFISVTIPAVSSLCLGATEDRQKGTARSFKYKGEVVSHQGDKLIMKESTGQRIELHVDADTVIPGLPGAGFKRGDVVEAEVTPEGHAKSIRPAR